MLLHKLILIFSCIQYVAAQTYVYVITYTSGNFIFHIKLLIWVKDTMITTLPETRIVEGWGVDGTDNSEGLVRVDIPQTGQDAPRVWARPRNQVLRFERRSFEIGIDQEVMYLQDSRHRTVEVPAAHPRLILTTDRWGVPYGFCDLSQGAISIAQNDGQELEPLEKCPNGMDLTIKIGVWLLCTMACANLQ